MGNVFENKTIPRFLKNDPPRVKIRGIGPRGGGRGGGGEGGGGGGDVRIGRG